MKQCVCHHFHLKEVLTDFQGSFSESLLLSLPHLPSPLSPGSPLKSINSGISPLNCDRFPNSALQQWFNMYKPITYNTNLLAEETNSFVNKLDPSKVFKSKNKTLSPKKKGPVQPAGGQKGPSVPSFTSKFSCSPGNPVGNEHPHFPASPTAMISMHRRPKPLPI